MVPLKDNQKENIIKRLSFIDIEINDLQKFKNLSYNEYKLKRDKRRNVERIEENILNAIIDIGKVLLLGENIEIPTTYREIFTQLGQHNVIPEKLGEELSKLVRLRNILSHQYLDLSWDYIKNFMVKGQINVKQFIKIVEKYS
ncbi:MAG: HepT-like ribonuclease domain-containing protein [bacterium]